MITSVYIANDRIQVLTGDFSKAKLDVGACMQEALPDKAVVNGVIHNDIDVKETINKLWDNYNLPKKNVSLVVDSSTILNKKAVVPVLPKASLLNLVRDEFKDVEGNANFLYDYTVIEDGHGGEPMVFCNAVNKEFIGAYLKVFKDSGIKLDGINTAVAAESALVSFHPLLKNQTEIVVAADGAGVTSVLYIDGKYNFCSRGRINEKRGTEGAYMEFARILSSLIQFARSENSAKPVSAVYICGLVQGEENLCGRLQSALGCAVTTIPACDSIACMKDTKKAEALMSDYLYPLGNMLHA